MPPARIPREMPMHVHRQREGMSEAHIEMIRQLPCAVTGSPPRNDPHHLMRVDKKARGMGMTTADQWAIPLSRAVHDQVENDKEAVMLGEEAWLTSKGVLGRELAKALWAVRDGTLADYQRVMDRHFQEQRLRRLTTGRGE